jgi:hypothetical protein
MLEAARLSVENGLNAVAEEADRIVGRHPAPKTDGASAP